jgi:hypothetical protein
VPAPTEPVAKALERLVALVDSELPRTYWRGEGPWPFVAAAFLARMADIAESVAVLLSAAQRPDASILSRVMYEQVVTFCWLAINPDERLQRWTHAFEAQQRIIAREAQEYGMTLLTDEELEEAAGKKKIDLKTMAVEANDYWIGRIPGFGPAGNDNGERNILSIRGLYLGTFRADSRLIHATPESIGGSVRRGKWARQHVVGRSVNEMANFAPTILPLFVLAIEVHHRLFNWPDVDAARRVNADLAGELSEIGEI